MQLIDQDPDAVEPETFALLVEVKVRVVNPRVREGVQRALVRLLDRLLVPGRVDEVHEELVAVKRNLLVEMPPERVGLVGGGGGGGGGVSAGGNARERGVRS